MRLLLACLVLLASTPAIADGVAPSASVTATPRAHAGRYAGAAVLTIGVVATVVSQVLLAEGIGWELGNGLGEHYDPTPAWVPTYETAGWTLLATGQAAIVSGIVLVARF